GGGGGGGGEVGADARLNVTQVTRRVSRVGNKRGRLPRLDLCSREAGSSSPDRESEQCVSEQNDRSASCRPPPPHRARRPGPVPTPCATGSGSSPPPGRCSSSSAPTCRSTTSPAGPA